MNSMKKPAQKMYTSKTISITQLKDSPSECLKICDEKPVAILSRSTVVGYLVPKEYFEKMESSK